MAGVLAGMAARYVAPMAAQAVGTFVQGKMGESIGDRNVNEANRIGQESRSMNEDPTLQGNRQAASSQAAQEGSNARSMAQAAYMNQMTQANKRADNIDQRTTYEQDNAFQRGKQLADNYANASIRQAESNNNVLSSMLGIGGTARR